MCHLKGVACTCILEPFAHEEQPMFCECLCNEANNGIHVGAIRPHKLRDWGEQVTNHLRISQRLLD